MTAKLHDEPEFDWWCDAIDAAKALEREADHDKRWYVVKLHDDRWCVTEVEPYVSDEWYTADGVRGGGAAR
jgi:hypothetical protein